MNNYPSIIDPLIPIFAPIVGREREFVRLKDSCISGNDRNITIIGLPGVGKTALAATLAHDPQIRRQFDGILWAGLGAYQVPKQRLIRWGTLLGISATEIDRNVRKKTMQDIIGSRRMLLILDDAWKLEDIQDFQVGGPNCAHLITTRFPSIATQLVATTPFVLNELSTEQGLDLLHVLAPQIVEQEAQQARLLVEGVGGLPLALVLMGNFLRRQSLGGQTRRIHAALQQVKSAEMRLQLSEPRSPITPHPSMSSSQRISLSSVVSVSDQQLSLEARHAFYTLGALPPKPQTFSEDAALAVSTCPVEILDELMDTGLLESGGDSRYALHQTIADYAHLHLQGIEPYERLMKYAQDFVTLHKRDYELLDLESATILAALEAAHRLNHQAVLVRLACAFAPFLLLHGNYEQAGLILHQAYTAALALHDHGLVGTLLYLGELAEKQGKYAQAEAYLREGLTHARQIGDRERMCALLSLLGSTCWKQGRYPQAEAYLHEGLDLAHQSANQDDTRSELLSTLGAVSISRGDYPQAEAYLHEGLALARQIGERKRICVLLMNLGVTSTEQGQYTQAELYFEEGLMLARQINHYERTSALLCNLGAVVMLQGRYAEAEAYQREGLILARQIGHREWMGILLLNLGETSVAQMKYIQGQFYFQETVKLAQQLNRPQLIARALYEMGSLYLKQRILEDAEVAFQEMMRVIPQGDLELHALSQYGFARLCAEQGDIQKARQLGEMSATAFENMRHCEAEQVRNWLASI